MKKWSVCVCRHRCVHTHTTSTPVKGVSCFFFLLNSCGEVCCGGRRTVFPRSTFHGLKRNKNHLRSLFTFVSLLAFFFSFLEGSLVHRNAGGGVLCDGRKRRGGADKPVYPNPSVCEIARDRFVVRRTASTASLFFSFRPEEPPTLHLFRLFDGKIRKGGVWICFWAAGLRRREQRGKGVCVNGEVGSVVGAQNLRSQKRCIIVVVFEQQQRPSFSRRSGWTAFSHRCSLLVGVLL
ncbi:hypothetical protein ABB37_05342 [Leptomonas pyrrhocoris]|uniref:Transmembrane protein n=1 Tax=Leptomonas pyrrhocoris TaxID=157538 RepID=A0A0N0DUW4_LEPPY|nr:hypothetical protein ABB37_05342 [Leptomonas pyrrhocoris]KPA79518.1 hypothetical protein ABB37_05342 [Leptomonas pyrrhocoris]|eukprot:XP_015657957.1 hypothetical protein ABB37_05342 [Leptomonas pyrrhocoris]